MMNGLRSSANVGSVKPRGWKQSEFKFISSSNQTQRTSAMAARPVINNSTEPLYNHSYGALLGVFVGDAAGATLEFSRAPSISEAEVRHAMRMPGGGKLKVGPGQITDDSELAISMAKSLSEVGPSAAATLPMESIAARYADWYASKPFNMGRTCRAAFGGAHKHRMQHGGNIAQVMKDIAAAKSCGSEANGALMRVVPLPIWMAARGKDPMAIAEAAKQDALLSHPNPVCQECNAVYSLALAYLLTHPGDRHGAVAAAENYANSHMQTDAKRWLLHDSAKPDVVAGMDCAGRTCGHVRFAFVLAFHFLRIGPSFEESILRTLVRAGDTDTNAAIVGGLMGAFHGADAIPGYMKDPVLRFDCANATRGAGRRRPAIYATTKAHQIILGLLGNSV